MKGGESQDPRQGRLPGPFPAAERGFVQDRDSRGGFVPGWLYAWAPHCRERLGPDPGVATAMGMGPPPALSSPGHGVAATKLGHGRALGTPQVGDGMFWGHKEHMVALGWVPQEAAGTKPRYKASLGCWWGHCGDRDRPHKLAARWQPMARKGSQRAWGQGHNQTPLDHGHHHWATYSRQPGRAVVTVLSPWAQSVGTQSHCRSQW